MDLTCVSFLETDVERPCNGRTNISRPGKHRRVGKYIRLYSEVTLMGVKLRRCREHVISASQRPGGEVYMSRLNSRPWRSRRIGQFVRC